MPKLLSINELIHESINFPEMGIKKFQAQFNLLLSVKVPKLELRTQFQQVVINILTNTFDAVSGLALTRRTIEIKTSKPGVQQSLLLMMMQKLQSQFLG